MPSYRPQAKGLLKLCGPIFFALLLWRVVNPEVTLNLVRGLQPAAALLSLLLIPAVNAVIAWRWWFICRKLQMNASYGKLFRVYYASWFLGAIPLLGVALLAKFIYLHQEGQPAGPTAASIALDKLFDVFGLMLFGLFGLVYLPASVLQSRSIWIFYAAAGLGLAVVLLFGKRLWQAFRSLLQRRAGKIIQRMAGEVEAEAEEVWNRLDLKFLWGIIAVSIGVGLLRSLVLYVLAAALNIRAGFGLIVACRALIGIVNIVPISISGLGTRDTVLLLILPLAGVSREAALALGILAFLWTLASKFTGLPFWLLQPVSLSNVFAAKK